ncbi:polyisoprenoid-binding protein YceI [Isoptericola sp. CG 20/1183]|uniref:Polyisoprenoid-binding protein YceI n=1 Tax=Isoptericola halotolerans TaxID=300560 RepID=A0ABX5EJ47_9MICO|nr:MULTISPECIES: YceI family protein [Isoptericola]MCK0117244.1 YceI family protein [Isoptericola sp. S6320L]PRZ09666.1 polyisoprenoid-binding protein YceI [Isoptericola sp. CG 20/1183]PRZ10467.1 polyisoprenoid-binding protein YceI [Isoptericola halotolerans]
MATPLPTGLTTGTYVIDAAHSTASFTVRHAGISKVRGTIGITTGTITVGDDLDSTSVSAELDAASVNTGDENRDGHLKSADFWHAEEKPVWSFASKNISVDGDAYVITGDLTINGVTKTVDLPTEFAGTAKDPFGNDRAGFESELEISRRDFDLTWNATLETGGFLVGDKVKIALDVSAISQN